MAALSLLSPYNDVAAWQDRSNPDALKARLKAVDKEIRERSASRNQHRQQAAAAKEDYESLSKDIVAIARDIQLREEQASLLEVRVEDLTQLRSEKQGALEVRREELAEILGALQRLERLPPVTALIRPEEAVTVARTAELMATILPALSERAAALRKELTELHAIETDLTSQRIALTDAMASLARERSELGRLQAKRRQEANTAIRAANQEAAKLRKLATEAKSLKDLIEKLERERAAGRLKAPTGGSIIKSKGKLIPPATGRLMKKFGQEDGPLKSKGITLRTRASAQVTAPFDGQVVFARPFMSYGQLLIIDHGGGYHTLLAGLARLNANVGQLVSTGEPVGTMSSRGGESADLYVEIRAKGKAVNPAPWFRMGLAAK